MPEYGKKRIREEEGRMRDEWESGVEELIDEAYKALARTEMAEALGKVTRLYFQIERAMQGVHSYNRHRIEHLLEGTEYFEDYTENGQYIAIHRLLERFEDVAEGQGFEVGMYGKVVDPMRVIGGFEDSDYHLGATMWMRENAPRVTDGTIKESLKALEASAIVLGVLPAKVDETYVLGEDFEDSPLHEMYEKRRRQGRSLQGIIVARDNDTGTGKTTLAVGLCKKWGDDWGAENATNRAGEYREFLNNKPEGSVLLADEIGQMFDSRRSMSSENVAVSQDWQMIRTKEYVTLSTLPGPSFLDKRLKKLADVMILCTRRGHARVYRLKVDDSSGDVWREHICNVEWGALDGDEDYQKVEEMKRGRLKERFEGGDEDDVDEQFDEDTARREGRNETICQLVESGLTQTEIAEALEMDQSTVSRIVRESSD